MFAKIRMAKDRSAAVCPEVFWTAVTKASVRRYPEATSSLAVVTILAARFICIHYTHCLTLVNTFDTSYFMVYNLYMDDRVHIGFRDDLSQKERLTALAAIKTRDGLGTVSESDLLREALERLLNAEEAQD